MDKEIEEVINTPNSNAVSVLFERYRLSNNPDEFVAALIGRLCMLHAQSLLKQSQTWLRDGVGA